MFTQLINFIKADYRSNYGDCALFKFLIKDVFFPNYRFRFLFWLRCCECFRRKKVLFPFYALSMFFWNHYSYKSQLEIPFYTIGKGAFFKHSCGAIIINARASIGDCCLLSPGVIVGISSIQRKDECPIIANNVYLSPNCKIFGKCHIGNNVIIGTDTVIRDMDIPDDCYAVGNPVKIRKLK